MFGRSVFGRAVFGRAVLGAVLLALGLSAAACGSSSSAGASPSGRIAVLAVENVWGDVARQIGGDHVVVTSILKDPDADPHTYETDPRTAAAVGSARFVVENGLGYDEFADKLLSAGGRGDRRVLTVADAAGVSGADANPHLWYSPQYVRAAATAIAAQLTQVQPASAADFSAGLKTFLAAYQPYVDTLAKIRASYAGAPVSYTERVPGYLIDAAGLELATPASFAQSIEDGSDPSPADTDAIDRAMTGRTVKVLFYNSQVTSPVTARVQELARASGVPVVGVAETIPAGEPDFQTWQLDQAKAVLSALGG